MKIITDKFSPWAGFPAPLEVDRYLYYLYAGTEVKPNKFPSPLEVDRFLYEIKDMYKYMDAGFRPLSRWIGSYTL